MKENKISKIKKKNKKKAKNKPSLYLLFKCVLEFVLVPSEIIQGVRKVSNQWEYAEQISNQIY